MFLRYLAVRNFRNYTAQELPIGPGVTVLYGPNGAGKTNLLEAVHLTATGESPRAQEVPEMVRFGEEHAFVSARFHTARAELHVEVGLARHGQRQIRVNGVLRRRADLIGLAPVVHFTADDISTIRGEPSGRRRLLDTELGNLSRGYYQNLLRYRRTIEQRNRLLRDVRAGRGRAEALAPWDRAAARYGAHIVAERAAFVSSLSRAAAAAQVRLGQGQRCLSVEYRPSVGSVPTQWDGLAGKNPEVSGEALVPVLEEQIRAHREADMATGSTTIGPHRDDLEVLQDGRPVRAFASQGQQRVAALAIRLGVAALAEAIAQERPVLLLDDVLSELDPASRAGVFEACRHAEQAVLTSADPEHVPVVARQHVVLCEVRDGQLV